MKVNAWPVIVRYHWAANCNRLGGYPERGPRCDHEHHLTEVWMA